MKLVYNEKVKNFEWLYIITWSNAKSPELSPGDLDVGVSGKTVQIAYRPASSGLNAT